MFVDNKYEDLRNVRTELSWTLATFSMKYTGYMLILLILLFSQYSWPEKETLCESQDGGHSFYAPRPS